MKFKVGDIVWYIGYSATYKVIMMDGSFVPYKIEECVPERGCPPVVVWTYESELLSAFTGPKTELETLLEEK